MGFHGGARIYDRHGTLMYEFVDELSGLRRPVKLDEVSPWVTKATISVEDPDFEENVGVNYRGLLRVARREGGTRVYAVSATHTPEQPSQQGKTKSAPREAEAAFDALVDVVLGKYERIFARVRNAR